MTPKVLELARQEGRRPTWEMALVYPDQGGWTVDDYLDLDLGRHIEFTNGSLEFQPMPNEEHQAILFFLVSALKTYAARHGGRAHMAPLPMRLWDEKFREPDALYMSKKHLNRCRGKYWDGADLVLEIASSTNRQHDFVTKRREYARASIPEYWIVDAEKATITVLTLKKGRYSIHGQFKKNQSAHSALLPGFAVDVKSALEAE